jgi:hypothetical protein
MPLAAPFYRWAGSLRWFRVRMRDLLNGLEGAEERSGLTTSSGLFFMGLRGAGVTPHKLVASISIN